MRHSIRRVLALIIALWFAMPGIYAEPIADAGDSFDAAEFVMSDDVDISTDAGDLSVPALDDELLADAGEQTLDALDAEEPSPDPVPSTPTPFAQSAQAGDVTIRVTAGAGAFPEDASLRVSDAPDETLARAAMEAVETLLPGVALRHHLYYIEVLDGAGNPCLPGDENELPLVKVNGLTLNGAARVVVYDRDARQGSELEATGEIEFRFVGSAIYDVVEVTDAAEDEDASEEVATETTSSDSPEGEPASPQGEASEEPEDEDQSPDDPQSQEPSP